MGEPVTVCVASAPQTLTGSPIGGVWTGPGVSGSVATGFVFTPTPALLGVQTLTYTVTGAGPCGGVSTLQLTVVPSPPVAFTAPIQTSFCLNSTASSVVLAATPAGGTFSGPGVAGNFFYPYSVGPGTHVVTYSVNTGGCLLQTTQTLTVIGATVGPDFTACTNRPPVPLVGSPAGGVWTGPGVSGSVATGFIFTPTAALLGSQLLTYTVLGAGCSSSTSLRAIVVLAPAFTSPTLPTYCNTSSAPVALPSGAIWTGRGVQGPFASGYQFTPSLAGTGLITLNYFTGYGPCDVSGTITVIVASPPTVTLPPDTLLCPGSTLPFRLRGTPAGGTWTGPHVTSAGVFMPPAGFTGQVTLTYTLTTGPCVSMATCRVGVAEPPTYPARWEPELCAEARQAPLAVRFSDLLNNFIGGTRWDFGDGTQGTGNTTTHVYTQPGRYTPRITRLYNNGLCSVQLDLPVVEVTTPYDIPNIITPNGDDKNELFKATNGCPAHLQVFSRWGNKVFESASYQNDWNGGQLPNGVYYYLLRQQDGTAIKGWLEISR